ncbi:1-phosphofructokinase [Deinococcus sp. HSC-46F16]|uniref:1-phosphofructokinase n=1 Tax=Deinococcus sp. HSC-46F16 TaxID=2910968 RepID=UPI00209D5881|nr:1-phosphofructokinase [Deinococcus sp. HSC-46F16]MCP2014409.1 1-phosphofructokinase [Deinococcus sp. HSC-46F16]
MITAVPRVATLTLNPALDLTVRADGWRRGEVNLGQALHWAAGGKGVNVASFLADRGLGVTATGLLGSGNPEQFETLFRAKGIRDAFVRVPGATRVGVKLVDGAAQVTTDINLPGLAATPEALEDLEERLLSLTQDHAVFVLAGSLPPGVNADFYARLIRRVRAAGRFVALDTSGAALGAALSAATLPDLVKPNIHELEAALGRSLAGEADVLAAAHELIRRGAGLVAVSQGERGALLVTAGEAVRARPPRVRVQSTVGAGDAMVAGLVAAHTGGLDLAAAARYATAFSVGAITRLGAHLPPDTELDAFAAQVQVDVLDGMVQT